MSALINSNFGLLKNGSIFFIFPVDKSSTTRIREIFGSSINLATKFYPITPAPPVINNFIQVFFNCQKHGE